MIGPIKVHMIEHNGETAKELYYLQKSKHGHGIASVSYVENSYRPRRARKILRDACYESMAKLLEHIEYVNLSAKNEYGSSSYKPYTVVLSFDCVNTTIDELCEL